MTEKEGEVNQLWLGWAEGSFSTVKMDTVSTGQERRERVTEWSKPICPKPPQGERKSKFSVSRMRSHGVNA